MKQKKIYTYICEDCGAAIQTTKPKRIVQCKSCYNKEQGRLYRERQAMKLGIYPEANTDIHNDIDELNKYNDEHGLNLSYGQYKLRLYLDKLGKRRKK